MLIDPAKVWQVPEIAVEVHAVANHEQFRHQESCVVCIEVFEMRVLVRLLVEGYCNFEIFGILAPNPF